MRVHSISKILALPMIAAAIIIGIQSCNQYVTYSYLIFVPVTLLVVLYVFHGPLDHWWLSRFPIPLDPRIKTWLQTYFVPYQSFSETVKKRFDYRLMLYIEGRLFSSVGKEMTNVPEDIKALIAAHAVHMGLPFSDYLIGDMDRIYLYKHPFPSPAYPFLHTVETNTEDGVLLFSTEQAINALLYPSDYYNIVYHGYAEALVATQNHIRWPAVEESDWAVITSVTGWQKEDILRQTGFSEVNLLPVWITLFFSKTEALKKNAPNAFDIWQSVFSEKGTYDNRS